MDQTEYIAFLRAVNVGGRIVKMTELKTIFQKLGFDDVSTFIASGNVIFTAKGTASILENRIERGLEASLHYVVSTMLRTTGEVASAVGHQPFPATTLQGASLYVGMMKRAASAPAIRALRALQTEVDELRVHGREVYWLARKNISEATITGAAIEKALQTPVTFRNINTLRRLAARYPLHSGTKTVG